MAVEHTVSLKIPTFWTSQPEVWLAYAKAHSNIGGGITVDEKKYFSVLFALDQDTAIHPLDLIILLPPDSKYKALIVRLLDIFGLNKWERAYKSLHFLTLGDTKFSALLDELALLSDHPLCLLFEQLFHERLPEDIRAQLVDA